MGCQRCHRSFELLHERNEEKVGVFSTVVLFLNSKMWDMHVPGLQMTSVDLCLTEKTGATGLETVRCCCWLVVFVVFWAKVVLTRMRCAADQPATVDALFLS